MCAIIQSIASLEWLLKLLKVSASRYPTRSSSRRSAPLVLSPTKWVLRRCACAGMVGGYSGLGCVFPGRPPALLKGRVCWCRCVFLLSRYSCPLPVCRWMGEQCLLAYCVVSVWQVRGFGSPLPQGLMYICSLRVAVVQDCVWGVGIFFKGLLTGVYHPHNYSFL